MLDIIFFAILAVILIFRLKSIIGREDSGSQFQGDTKKKKRFIIDITNIVERHTESKDREEKDAHAIIEKPLFYVSKNPILESVKNDFSDIEKIDPLMTPERLVSNASDMFSMVVSGYNNADLSSISSLMSDKMYNMFTSSIKNRSSVSLSDRMILVKIIEATITRIASTNNMIEIDVYFVSNQIHYTENSNKELISGSKKDVLVIKEVWTFLYQNNNGQNILILSDIKNSPTSA